MRIAAALFFCFLLPISGVGAERGIPGVYLEVEPRGTGDIERFLNAGIRDFFLYGIPSDELLNRLYETGARAAVALPGRNPTRNTVQRLLAATPSRVEEAARLGKHPAVSDVILFWCPQDPLFAMNAALARWGRSPDFIHSYLRYAGTGGPTRFRVHEILRKPADLANISAEAVSIVIDSRLFAGKAATDLQNLVNQLPENDQRVYVDAIWLRRQLDANPLFGKSTLVSIASTGSDVKAPHGVEVSYISTLLVLIWLWFAVRNFNDPTYRKSIHRFFFNHSFHASDVFNRQIRLSHSAWVISFQSMLLAGMVVESLFQFVVSPVEKQILFENVPLLANAAAVPFGFVLTGAAVQGIVISISAVWLRHALPGIRQYAQFMPIYAWTFHIHLIVIPFIIVLCISGSSLALVMFWGVLLLSALTLLSFYVVVWDFMRLMPAHRRRINNATLIPYTSSLLLVYAWLFYKTSFVEAILYASAIR